jgi:kynurenine formamidase
MIYDLSHTLVTGIPFFVGDPEPRVTAGLGARPWCVSALELGTHSGTHVDAPLHYISGGRGIDSYALEQLIRPGLVVDARGYADDAPIGPEVLAPYAIRPGMAVVIRTGWEQHWNDQRYFRHPHLSAALCAELVARELALVAVDALNVDSTPGGGELAHAALLGADMLIAENVRGLDQLVCGNVYIFAFIPIRLGNVDGAPVRALAWDLDHRFAEDSF